jgi:2-(1,2-epoxy-1,2-dihydrophenyl)acetyl-CoA isomerase
MPDNDFDLIGFQVMDGVAEITLNRPAVLNAFTQPMARQLQAALAAVAGDDAVRAVLLTGSGRAFCAGQDLAEAVPPDGSPAPPIEEIVRGSYNPVVRAIRALEKPVVCAVNGVAAGAGANLALACDIVIAGENASFVQSFCKIGLVPDTGGTFFLPRLVGTARATALAMLGDRVTAVEAHAAGMIWRVVAADALLHEARVTARHLAAQPTRGLGLIKRAMNASLANTLEQQLELEANLQAEAAATSDFAEGVAAFMAKRQPAFTGR